MVTHNPSHYETAAKVAVDLTRRLQSEPLPADTILNINVPDLPWDDIKGMQATRLGARHKSEGVVRQQDPRGDDIYWVGPPGEEQDAGEGTDFFSVKQGFISITPLQIDLTRYDSLQDLTNWLAAK